MNEKYIFIIMWLAYESKQFWYLVEKLDMYSYLVFQHRLCLTMIFRETVDFRIGAIWTKFFCTNQWMFPLIFGQDYSFILEEFGQVNYVRFCVPYMKSFTLSSICFIPFILKRCGRRLRGLIVLFRVLCMFWECFWEKRTCEFHLVWEKQLRECFCCIWKN